MNAPLIFEANHPHHGEAMNFTCAEYDRAGGDLRKLQADAIEYGDCELIDEVRAYLDLGEGGEA